MSTYHHAEFTDLIALILLKIANNLSLEALSTKQNKVCGTVSLCIENAQSANTRFGLTHVRFKWYYIKWHLNKPTSAEFDSTVHIFLFAFGFMMSTMAIPIYDIDFAYRPLELSI